VQANLSPFTTIEAKEEDEDLTMKLPDRFLEPERAAVDVEDRSKAVVVASLLEATASHRVSLPGAAASFFNKNFDVS
jgi:hypothetical protein